MAKSKLFSDAQIEQLRKEYAGIKTIDPCGPTYPKLVAMLDKMSQAMLKQLAEANINFVSMLARNRVVRRETPAE